MNTDSSEASLLLSLRPKLMETTETPGRLRAVLTAVEIKSASDGLAASIEDDVGLRGDGMGPFHVEGFFPRPTCRVRRRVAGAAVLIELLEAGRIGQAELQIELVQVAVGEIRDRCC